MKAQDLRPWIVQDATWTRGYAPTAEELPVRMPLEGFERLLESAAVSGDSAYIGVCFDLDTQK